nr:hypothetical protein [Tanacetum cinerariifolium]
ERKTRKGQNGIKTGQKRKADKIICNLDKTPDLSQRSPQNCPKCGNPVDGHYCHGCALLRKKFKEDLFTSCVENGILQDSSEPSNNNTNVANALQEPFEEEKQIKEEQEANAQYWKILACYNDDDDDYTFAITHKEPDNSLKSLLNHDSLTISSSLKIDSLLYKFAGELTLLKSISPGINEIDCDPEEEIHFIKRLLYDNSSPQPPEEFISENSDAAFEFFSPSPIPVEDSDSLMEEIDLYFTSDDPMPPGIEEDDYDSEGDILILEELLENDSLSFSKNESFHFDIPSSSRPPAKPPDGENGIKW